MADELLCTAQDVLDAWPQFAAWSATRQTALIARASQKILNFCRRGFAQVMVTESFDGRNAPAVWLSRRPVITVAAVSINGTALDNTYGDGWSFSPATGKLIRGNGQDDTRFVPWFPAGQGNIVVQYWAGYSAVPDPVVEAAVELVKYLSDRAKASGVYAEESIGDYSYKLAQAATAMTLPGHVADLLAEYAQDDGPL